MNRNDIIKIFKKELKGCDPESEMAQALELAVEILHTDKQRLGAQAVALEKIRQRIESQNKA